MATIHRPAIDLVGFVKDQLPREVQEQCDVQVASDAFHLRTIVRIKRRADGRVFDTQLAHVEVDGGRLLSLKLPDDFVTHLCVVL